MIRFEDPFADDPAGRDPVRRFRGRLAAPVTVVTAGSDGQRSGLTVSSLLAVEGEPGRLFLVVGPTSDLWSTVTETSRLVVHVCRAEDRHLAEVFAGLRPSPGGPFSGLAITMSDWGPVIDHLPDRAFCTVEGMEEVGFSGLLRAVVDRVEASHLQDPLVYFRGRFRALD